MTVIDTTANEQAIDRLMARFDELNKDTSTEKTIYLIMMLMPLISAQTKRQNDTFSRMCEDAYKTAEQEKIARMRDGKRAFAKGAVCVLMVAGSLPNLAPNAALGTAKGISGLLSKVSGGRIAPLSLAGMTAEKCAGAVGGFLDSTGRAGQLGLGIVDDRYQAHIAAATSRSQVSYERQRRIDQEGQQQSGKKSQDLESIRNCQEKATRAKQAVLGQ